MTLRHMGNHIKIVSGKRGYALYDLKKGNVYHLNYEAYKVIQNFLSGENTFNEDERHIIDILNELEFTKDLFDDNMPCMAPKLSYVWLEITEVCNLNCIHCYGEWGCPIEDYEKTLKLNEWKDIIDKIYDSGCRQLQFIGGEPMCSPYFKELAVYAHQKGMSRLDVFTNGTLIDDSFIALFKELGINVRVSVYGHNASTHDRITKRKGSFDKTIYNIKKLQKAGIEVRIAVIIMNENENYISEIEEFISSLGSHGYDTIRQTTYGTQLNHAVKDINVLKKRYQCHPDFSISRKEFELNQCWNSCWYGKVAVTSKGDIIPCIFARECILGNVRSDTRDEIKNKVLEMWKLSKDQIDGCKECEYRYACHDCRPLAKGLTGNLFAKYPRCCYDPNTGEWKDISEITLELASIE